MPALGMIISKALSLPPSLSVGLILVSILLHSYRLQEKHELYRDNSSSQHQDIRMRSRQKQDMSRAIDLFRKYILSRPQHSHISEAIMKKRSSPRALVPSMPGRPASFLERHLFPRIGLDAVQSSLVDYKPSKGQLTIFYAGTINVYDDVPIDKAQAIMLLAGDNSLSAGYGLPIARKFSLQHFLEKRRQRIVNKSPYASFGKEVRRDQIETKLEKGFCENKSNFLSPFPSRSEPFFPVSPSIKR